MAKFSYRMQNILDIKQKLEDQAKIAYGLAEQNYRAEQKKLQDLLVRRSRAEKDLKQLMDGNMDLQEIRNRKSDLDSFRVLIRRQMMEVHRVEKELEEARQALNEVMQERKMHEKLKEKALDEYHREELVEEGKMIDGLVSFTYNAKQ